MKVFHRVVLSLLVASVAGADEPDALTVEEAQRALTQSGLQVDPQLVKRVLPTLDAAVKRRLELEEATRKAPHELAVALDRRATDEPGIARALEQLTRDAALRHVLASSDATWKVLSVDKAPPARWARPDFEERGWRDAVPQGRLGTPPWNPVFDFVSPSKAEWIWSYASNSADDRQTVLFRKRFVARKPGAVLSITADNAFEVFLDGELVGRGDDWQRSTTLALTLAAGKSHLLAVKVVNHGGPGGLLVDLR